MTNYVGDENTNTITGGSSADKLKGRGGDDRLDGGGGSDKVIGGGGDDFLLGGIGDDQLLGGGGSDTFAGNDTGNDTMDGGSGVDWVSYAGYELTTGVRVSLAFLGVQDTGGAGVDKLLRIENLEGSYYDDTLLGNGAANEIWGSFGDDYVDGGAGNDVLNRTILFASDDGDDIVIGGEGDDVMFAGSGSDVLIGGAGHDLVSFDSLTTPGSDPADYHASLASHGLQDVGGESGSAQMMLSGVEELRGGAGNDVLAGSDGDDTLDGGGGFNLLDGGAGFDFVRYSRSTTKVTVDLSVTDLQNTGPSFDDLTAFEGVIGSDLNDKLTGASGGDWLIGNAGGDLLKGQGGADTLSGGDGTDVLTGASGADLLVGGGGIDFFMYAAASDSTAAATDLIWDLGADDLISFQTIDADTTTGGNQAFTIVATRTGPGQMVLDYSAGPNETVIRLYTNADSIADSVITVRGDATGFEGFVL